MPSSLENLVVRFIESDPQLSRDPEAMSAVQAIKSGDAQAIEQSGRNLSQRVNMKPQDLYVQGLKMLGL